MQSMQKYKTAFAYIRANSHDINAFLGTNTTY
jgi:hypothetical protein